MYRQERWLLVSIGLLLCFCATSLHAALMTFNVDLSGVAAGSGHTLRAFGTITVDPLLPMSRDTTTSNLQFQHHTDLPVLMPSTPTLGAAVPSQLAWGVFGGNLYVTRTGSANEYFGWAYRAGGEAEVLFGSGVNSHNLFYSGAHVEALILKPPGAPDGPNGFLVGTLVPEPSSWTLSVAFGALFARRRRRRPAHNEKIKELAGRCRRRERRDRANLTA
jgi:hypothetical protein